MTGNLQFRNRYDAGERLAHALGDLRGQTDLLVLGIPRGGVVVAYRVARALDARLDVCLTHKLGAPGKPELAIGAVAEDGITVLDNSLISFLSVSAEYIKAEAERQRQELTRRAQVYRGERSPARVAGQTVIVIDDGVATGATMAASLQALAAHHPASIIAAIPVAPEEAVSRLQPAADRVLCLTTPKLFWSVSSFYDDFGQVRDEEVVALLSDNARSDGLATRPTHQTLQ